MLTDEEVGHVAATMRLRGTPCPRGHTGDHVQIDHDGVRTAWTQRAAT